MPRYFYMSCHYNICSRIIRFVMIMSFFLLATGCATPGSQSFHSTLPEELRREIRTVAVLPGEGIPKNNFLTYAKNRNKGAAQGAAAGASYGALYMAAESARSGPFGVLLLPYMAAAGAIVGGLAGGIEGAIKAVPADEAERIEAAINHAVDEIHIQDKFAESVIDAGIFLTEYNFNFAVSRGPQKNNYKVLPFDSIMQSPDIEMEVRITDLGFRGGGGRDPAVSFFMDAAIRLSRVRDGKEIYSGKSSHSSRPQRFSEWSRNNANPLRLEFERTYMSIAEQVIENLFLIHDFHLDSIWSTDMYCMLKPVNPPLTTLGFFSRERITPKLVSRRPTFQWEAFPRDKDLRSDSKGLLSHISDISYDLIVWKTRDNIPTELVYDKRGLVLTERTLREERIVEYTIDKALESSTEHYWSVRARFMLDGKPRITRWSYSRIPWNALEEQDPCLADHIPLSNYYRFMTP
jgi:hypothetical protein